MGKVLRTVAVLAATVAIAVYAPQLSAALLQAIGTTTATALASLAVTTAVTAGLTFAAGAIFAALARPPSATASTRTYGGVMRPWAAPAPTFESNRMAPVQPDQQHAPWWLRPWRYSVVPIRETCLNPRMPGRHRWAIIDRRATIYRNDIFVFDCPAPSSSRFLVGRFGWWRGAWYQATWGGFAKIFIGCSPSANLFETATTNPRGRQEGDLRSIRWAFKVVEHHPSLIAATRAVLARYRKESSMTWSAFLVASAIAMGCNALGFLGGFLALDAFHACVTKLNRWRKS